MHRHGPGRSDDGRMGVLIPDSGLVPGHQIELPSAGLKKLPTAGLGQALDRYVRSARLEGRRVRPLIRANLHEIADRQRRVLRLPAVIEQPEVVGRVAVLRVLVGQLVMYTRVEACLIAPNMKFSSSVAWVCLSTPPHQLVSEGRV